MGTTPQHNHTIIDFIPAIDEHDQEVFIPEDMVLADGQLTATSRGLAVTSPAAPLDVPPDTRTRPVSVVPRERMASAWSEVAEALRRAEEGDAGQSGKAGQGGQEVVMNPGGQMEVTTGGTTRPVSRVPQDRMASKPYIRFSDTDEIRTADEFNVEGWTPVHTRVLDGWRFRLQPLPGGQVFTFVAFRSPNDAGRWRLWVLSPNMDGEFGHVSHMITTLIDGEAIPVICGAPGGAAAGTLAEARTMAGKWATYTQRRLLNQDPVFSK